MELDIIQKARAVRDRYRIQNTVEGEMKALILHIAICESRAGGTAGERLESDTWLKEWLKDDAEKRRKGRMEKADEATAVAETVFRGHDGRSSSIKDGNG